MKRFAYTVDDDTEILTESEVDRLITRSSTELGRDAWQLVGRVDQLRRGESIDIGRYSTIKRTQ